MFLNNTGRFVYKQQFFLTKINQACLCNNQNKKNETNKKLHFLFITIIHFVYNNKNRINKFSLSQE